MSTEVLSQTLVAGVKAIFGSGTGFVIVTATTPVTIVARQIGNSNANRTFANVPAGFKFTADAEGDGFDTLEVTSTVPQVFTIAVGTDDVEFSNAVTVTGGVLTTEVPAATLSDIAAAVTVATGVQTALCAANGARRRITVSADPANLQPVYIRKTGGANNIAFIQPGMSLEFVGTYGLDYSDTLNGHAGGNTLYLLEES